MATLKIDRKTIGRDVLAGLTAAIAAIPDGMASAVLAGVNPIYGLYNLMVGTPVAALFTSSVYMAVINTSAMALVVNSALTGLSGEEQLQAMVTLTNTGRPVSIGAGAIKVRVSDPIHLQRGHDRLLNRHRRHHHPITAW